MNNSILCKQILAIQCQYRELLELLKDRTEEYHPEYLVYEIQQFWQVNKQIISCFLQFETGRFTAYAFTGAVILDIKDKEHLPFLAIGNMHIWDDPIASYFDFARTQIPVEYKIKINGQIEETIADNIRILENYNGSIIILPIRYLFSEKDLSSKLAEKLFLSLFENKFTLDEYFDRYIAINEVFGVIRKDIIDSIVLSSDDNMDDSFINRFNAYKNSNMMPISGLSDNKVLYFALIGYLKQAADILITCFKFNIVPYIRFDVAFKYFLQIASQFLNHKDIKEMVFKSAVVNILMSIFDKDRININSINLFFENISRSNFRKCVWEELGKNGISIENPAVEETIGILKELLEKIYTD